MDNMLIISAVEPQKRKKERYNIYIDGTYTASLGAEACVVYAIRAGAKISEDTLKEAVMHDNTSYAFDSALHLISHKMRTQSEIETRLKDRGIDADAIAAAIEKLIGYGYIDDIAYAEAFVQSAVSAGSHGPKVVSHKLKQKGLGDDIISEALRTYSGDVEKDIAGAQMSALRQRYAGEDRIKRRRKMFATLQRRGFSYDIINTLLSEEDDFEI